MRIRIGWKSAALLGCIAAWCLLTGATAEAQDKVGTTGVQFLEIGVSPRADAVGGAFTSIADDVSAVYYNPAGLVQLESRQVMVSLIDYPADITHSFAAIAFPGLGGMIGIGYYGLDAGVMDVTDYGHQYPTPGWTFQAKDYALSLTYARSLTDRFSVGGTMKVIEQRYEEENAYGWGADLGSQYNTGFRNFKISMMMSNFGPDMKFIEDEFPLPINFKFGGAIDVMDGPQHHAVLAIEGAHPSDNREKYNAGIEYTFNRFASFRVGNRWEYDIDGFSFGGGLVLNIGDRKVRMDYGYQEFAPLTEVHRFSFALDF
jgi:long-subunit fatty acid transport protein